MRQKPRDQKERFEKPKDQRPSRFDIAARMVLHEAGLISSVSPSQEALKVIRKDKFPTEAAAEFISWNEGQQADFLRAFDKESDTLRHEVFTAIMRRKNGTSLTDSVSSLLSAMDFENKALEIAMGYIKFNGLARELVPELMERYTEPLQRKLLAEAFEMVRADKDCGDHTKGVLHRVVRGLNGDSQYQYDDGPGSAGHQANPTSSAEQASP
jgi:hypothetical protein